MGLIFNLYGLTITLTSSCNYLIKKKTNVNDVILFFSLIKLDFNFRFGFYVLFMKLSLKLLINYVKNILRRLKADGHILIINNQYLYFVMYYY